MRRLGGKPRTGLLPGLGQSSQFRVFTLNARAFFHFDLAVRQRKLDVILKHALNFDIILTQEVHGNVEAVSNMCRMLTHKYHLYSSIPFKDKGGLLTFFSRSTFKSWVISSSVLAPGRVMRVEASVMTSISPDKNRTFCGLECPQL